MIFFPLQDRKQYEVYPDVQSIDERNFQKELASLQQELGRNFGQSGGGAGWEVEELIQPHKCHAVSKKIISNGNLILHGKSEVEINRHTFWPKSIISPLPIARRGLKNITDSSVCDYSMFIPRRKFKV